MRRRYRPAVRRSSRASCPTPTATCVGHLRTYVVGDAYSRALERVGQQTAFVCGSDMQDAHRRQRREGGRRPRGVRPRLSRNVRGDLSEVQRRLRQLRPHHDETNTELTQSFVESWIDGDHVYEQEIPGGLRPEADQWLPDRFVRGPVPTAASTPVATNATRVPAPPRTR